MRKPAAPASLLASPLGQTTSHAELRQLDRIGTIVSVPAGRRVVVDNAVGRECFVVVDGEFMVESSVGRGTLGAGDVVGELALLTGRRRNADVSSSSDAVVYALNRREFATLLATAPGLQKRIVTDAAERLKPYDVKLPERYTA